jgi:hypothetical protein
MPLRILALVDGESDVPSQDLAWRRLVPMASSMTLRALLLRCDRALERSLAAHGVTTAEVTFTAAPGWTSLANLVAAARAHGAQVLYAHGTAAHALCALAAPLLGVNVVAQAVRALVTADLHAHATCNSSVIVESEQAQLAALACGCRDVTVATRDCPDVVHAVLQAAAK